MREDELYPVEREASRSLVKGVREGLAYVARSRDLLLVLGTVTVFSLAGFNFHVILPLLASDTLHVGAEAFGLLSASFGVGALAGALSAATLGRASWKGFLAGSLGFSTLMLVLAPLETTWLCAALLFGVGVSFTLLTANANALVQIGTPAALRGRVLSLYLFAFAGLTPVGGLLAGWLVHLGGTQLSFAVAGLSGMGVTVLAVRGRTAVTARA
jgi:MFS family permease